MEKIRFYIVLIVGIATCLQAFAHAFMGFPAVLEHIANGEINGNATVGMQIIWLYSSIMMLLSGIWALFLAKPIMQSNHFARLQTLFLGIGLVTFGLICVYFTQEFFNHLFFFMVEGILLICAVTIFYKVKTT